MRKNKQKCPGPGIMRSLLSGWYHSPNSPKLDFPEITVTQWIGDGKAKNLNTLCVSLAVSCNDFLHNLAQPAAFRPATVEEIQHVQHLPQIPNDMGVLHLSLC